MAHKYSICPKLVCAPKDCSPLVNPCWIQTLRGSVQLLSHVSLWPHGLQYVTYPFSSPTPGAFSNSCPSSWWCHPTISSSVIPFSSCLQSFPGSGSFPMSQFFTSGGQSIGASASTSALPMNTQDWSPLGDLSQESSPTPQFKSISSLVFSFLCGPSLTSIHDHWKNHSFDLTDLCWQSNVSAF